MKSWLHRVSIKGANLSENTKFLLPVLGAAQTASTHSCDFLHSLRSKKSSARDIHKKSLFKALHLLLRRETIFTSFLICKSFSLYVQ